MGKIIKENLIELIAFLYDFKKEDKERISEEETYQKIEAAFLREVHWGFGWQNRDILYDVYGLTTGKNQPIEKCAQKSGLTVEKTTEIMNMIIKYLRHPGIKRRIVNSEDRKRDVYAVYGTTDGSLFVPDPEDYAPVNFLEVFSTLDEAMKYFKQRCLEIARSKGFAEAFAASTDEEILQGNYQEGLTLEQRRKITFFSTHIEYNRDKFNCEYWQMYAYEGSFWQDSLLPTVWIKRKHLYDEACEVPPLPTNHMNTPYFIDN